MTGFLALGVFGAAWAGVALLLAEIPWFRRGSLVERLSPYTPGSTVRRRPEGQLWRQLLVPLASQLGERVAAALGIVEPLALRLERVHSSVDPAAFRMRQVGMAVAGFGLSGLLAFAIGLPPLAAAAFLVSGGALGLLFEEQRLSSASADWKRRLFLELPVVAEQLAMLLAAGWSLTGALERLATRGSGAAAQDLERVVRRVRQGVPLATALREWSDIVRVPVVERLVSVLSLQHDTTDLGGLVADEARAMRREAHRELIVAVERRNQQVWIPVTVAALVPGALFMTIPFVEALRLFGG